MSERHLKPLLSGRSTVTITHPDGSLRFVDERRFRLEAEYARWAAEQDMLCEQRLIALQEGDTVTITGDATQLWWFTSDVRPAERQITGRTLIMSIRRETELSFDRVTPLTLVSPDDQVEANAYRAKLRMKRHPIELAETQRARLAAEMPAAFRKLLAMPEEPWHKPGCVCEQCAEVRHLSDRRAA